MFVPWWHVNVRMNVYVSMFSCKEAEEAEDSKAEEGPQSQWQGSNTIIQLDPFRVHQVTYC